MSQTAPNVIFFFTDQQRWDTCGCYGQQLPVTPNLDRMAAEGARFTNAYTCQPVCGPARACLQTGLYASEVNCPTNHCRLPHDLPLVARRMKARGYECSYIGKWHLASTGPRDGADDFREKAVPPHLRGGYDDFWLASDVLEFTSHSYDGHMFDGNGNRREFPAGRYRADAQTDWAIEYLESRDRSRPLYLMISYIEPHHQNDHAHFEGPRGSRERWQHFTPPGDLVDQGGNWREEYPDYLGCCNALDANLGRLRDTLDRLGMADDTVVIYTSDHGSHFCTRNSEYKRCCHDGCTHIPMVACGPGFTGGIVSDAMVNLIDVPATILAAGGVTEPPEMRGRPLQELCRETPPADWPDDIFMEISESQCGRAVRTARYTYSVRAPGDKTGALLKSPVYDEDFLYDNAVDPDQLDNRIADPALAEVRAAMRARLRRYLAVTGEAEAEIRPATPR